MMWTRSRSALPWSWRLRGPRVGGSHVPQPGRLSLPFRPCMPESHQEAGSDSEPLCDSPAQRSRTLVEQGVSIQRLPTVHLSPRVHGRPHGNLLRICRNRSTMPIERSRHCSNPSPRRSRVGAAPTGPSLENLPQSSGGRSSSQRLCRIHSRRRRSEWGDGHP